MLRGSLARRPLAFAVSVPADKKPRAVINKNSRLVKPVYQAEVQRLRHISRLAMAARMVVGRCLCTYTRLYGSRSLSSASRALRRQLLPRSSPSSTTNTLPYGSNGSNIHRHILSSSQPLSRLHTSRWLATEFNEPSRFSSKTNYGILFTLVYKIND